MIDALLAKLEREAEAEIAQITADARARVAALSSDAGERLARRREATLRLQEEEGRARVEDAVGAARQAARQQVLLARATLLARVFEELEKTLPEIAAGPAYRDALARDVTHALTFTGGEPAVLQCAPALVRWLRSAAKQNGRLTVNGDARVGPGFRMWTADGALEVDGTLAGRAQRLRPHLALKALAALEKEAPP
jgi:vacuolar-type H+-ATPase subunit E/Vma4